MQTKPSLKFLLMLVMAGSLTVSSGYLYQTEKVIQIDVSDLLNTRPVTTLTGGKLVPWTKGVDRENGYLTTSAALFNKEINPKAIPDDALIPATAHHPAIQLHYINTDGTKYQARLLADTGGMFTLKVPKHKYKDLFLCLTSAYGSSKLQLDLVYADGSEVKNFLVPDWANDVPDTDPNFSYVVHDLAKWSMKSTLTETDHHNIHALNIHPDDKRNLVAVKVHNLSKTYMLFWAATGVTH